MAKMVRSQVATGAYTSNSEVILDALRLWQQRQSEQTGRLDSIRAKSTRPTQTPTIFAPTRSAPILSSGLPPLGVSLQLEPDSCLQP